MTKEEKIKDVYQKLGFIWSKIEHLVTENGVLILPSPDLKYSLEGYENLVSDKEKFSSFGKDGLKLQPSALSGIYNNNGWVKIESEIDLPKDDDGAYWIANENGRFDFIATGYQIKAKWKNETCTHYKQIEFPKDPIY